MAEGFAYSIIPFQTREISLLKQKEEAKKQKVDTQSSESSASIVSQEESIPSEEVLSSGSTIQVLKERQSLPRSCYQANPKKWGYKNVVASSISFMLVFSTFLGLQSVQTSLNGSVGVVSLSLVYGFYLGVAVFTPTILRMLGAKYALLLGYSCHVLYIITNFLFETVPYALIPSSILLGIGSGPAWAGMYTQLARTANIVAIHLQVPIDTLLSKYGGVFFILYLVAHFAGNFISSVILYSGGSGDRITLDICSSFISDNFSNGSTSSVNAQSRYSILSVYLIMAILGFFVALIFVDPIKAPPAKVMKSKTRRFLKEPLVDLARVFISWKMLLLGGLTLYSGVQISFVYSSFTQQVISDCAGIRQVGFAMIFFGGFSAFASAICAFLSRKIPRCVFAVLAALVNLLFLLILEFHPLSPTFARIIIYIFAIFWGMADGVWRTLCTNFIGLLFPRDQETAYNVWRIWIVFGFTIGFAIASISSFDTRLRIVIVFLVFAFALYGLLELLCSKFGKKYICTCNLGVFDGPSTVPPVMDHSMLTETMLDTQIGLPSTNDRTFKKLHNRAYFSNGYAPPPVRSSTYSAGDSKNRRYNMSRRINKSPLMAKPSLVTVEERDESVQATEEIEQTSEQSLLHTAVF